MNTLLLRSVNIHGAYNLCTVPIRKCKMRSVGNSVSPQPCIRKVVPNGAKRPALIG